MDHYIIMIMIMWSGEPLNWFGSYLTDIIQRIVIEYCVSVEEELDLGRPRGSVLDRVICAQMGRNQEQIAIVINYNLYQMKAHKLFYNISKV